MRYRDRREAGRRLGTELAGMGALHEGSVLVLGVPRGGVPVAAEVARELRAELDVAIARKLGAPGNPELAIGAVAMDGEAFVDTDMLRRLGISDEYVTAEAERQSEELARRLDSYRRGRPPLEIEGRTVVVVDDGVATGSTLVAVLQWVRARNAGLTVCAVPVGSTQAVARLARHADVVVCPVQPRPFFAVGEWYDDFRQVGDAEVLEYLLEEPTEA